MAQVFDMVADPVHDVGEALQQRNRHRANAASADPDDTRQHFAHERRGKRIDRPSTLQPSGLAAIAAEPSARCLIKAFCNALPGGRRMPNAPLAKIYLRNIIFFWNCMTKTALRERKQRETDQRRKDILKVVRRMIAKGASRDITMRQVAEDAGFSTTMVYALFEDKSRLIAAAVDEDLLRLQKILHAAVTAGTTPLERLRLGACAYVEYGLRYPDPYFLMFMQPRPAAPPEASLLEQGNPERDPYALFRGVVAQLIDDGTLAATDIEVDVVTQALWEGIHGMTSMRIASGDDPWIRRLDAAAHLRYLIDILLMGIVQRFAGRKASAALKLLAEQQR